jgi:hypothetical protein
MLTPKDTNKKRLLTLSDPTFTIIYVKRVGGFILLHKEPFRNTMMLPDNKSGLFERYRIDFSPEPYFDLDPGRTANSLISEAYLFSAIVGDVEKRLSAHITTRDQSIQPIDIPQYEFIKSVKDNFYPLLTYAELRIYEERIYYDGVMQGSQGVLYIPDFNNTDWWIARSGPQGSTNDDDYVYGQDWVQLAHRDIKTDLAKLFSPEWLMVDRSTIVDVAHDFTSSNPSDWTSIYFSLTVTLPLDEFLASENIIFNMVSFSIPGSDTTEYVYNNPKQNSYSLRMAVSSYGDIHTTEITTDLITIFHIVRQTEESRDEDANEITLFMEGS